MQLGEPGAVQSFARKQATGERRTKLWIEPGASRPGFVKDRPSDDGDQNDKQRSCFWWGEASHILVSKPEGYETMKATSSTSSERSAMEELTRREAPERPGGQCLGMGAVIDHSS